MTTRDEAFAKLGQGHQLDEECKRIIAEEWGFNKVVRCEDCKFFGRSWCRIHKTPMTEKGFCSDGERKDGETDVFAD